MAASSKKRQREDVPIKSRVITSDAAASENRASKVARIDKSQILPDVSAEVARTSSTEFHVLKVHHILHPKLSETYDIHPISIISSTQITKKVTSALSTLSVFSSAIHVTKPSVVMMYAKASVASKMISVAEITKREIEAEGGDWYQYSRIQDLEEVVPPKKGKGVAKQQGGGREAQRDHEIDTMQVNDDDEDEDEAFELMKDPAERRRENAVKDNTRSIAVMVIYLSRVRIEEMRKKHGYERCLFSCIRLPLLIH
jgi:hypothetical protein